jgi:APA family basic amino acid/polyamine antiporter
MVGSVFSSDAWNNVTFIAGEIKNPQRNIGLSLILGTLSVTIIYFLANLMFVSLMPMQEIAFAKDDRIGVVAANIIFGNSGTYIIAILIMISTFGCNNGLILAGARVYSTMANDKLFFQKAAVINENGVPANGIWFQCIWASILCLTGKYGDLLDYVVFVVLLFYILTIVGIFILRRRLPEYDRPYKALGYPVLPLIYIIAASVLCLILFMYKPAYTWPGLGIVLLGIPVYYWAKKGIK